jgi:hypothetical protein
MKKSKKMPVDRKQSVYLDLDLQTLISNELSDFWNRGYLEMTPANIIRRRLRDSYGIPGVKSNVK